MRAPRKAKTRPIGPLPPVAEPDPADSASAEVLEFVTAIDAYKRKNQRPFPSWSEVLEIMKQLGYHRERKSA